MLTVIIGVAAIELVIRGARAVLTMQFFEIELECEAIRTLPEVGALGLRRAAMVTIVFGTFHV